MYCFSGGQRILSNLRGYFTGFNNAITFEKVFVVVLPKKYQMRVHCNRRNCDNLLTCVVFTITSCSLCDFIYRVKIIPIHPMQNASCNFSFVVKIFKDIKYTIHLCECSGLHSQVYTYVEVRNQYLCLPQPPCPLIFHDSISH